MSPHDLEALRHRLEYTGRGETTFEKGYYQAQQDIAKELALLARAELGERGPTEMNICEVPHLCLHVDQPYIFRKAAGCPDCEAYLNPNGRYDATAHMRQTEALARPRPAPDALRDEREEIVAQQLVAAGLHVRHVDVSALARDIVAALAPRGEDGAQS